MTERSSITITEKSTSLRQPASSSTAKTARRGDNPSVSAEERGHMIAMAAYYRAVRRGFTPGHDMEDWCEAEAEIDRQLGGD